MRKVNCAMFSWTISSDEDARHSPPPLLTISAAVALTFHYDTSLHYSPFLREVSLLRSDALNIWRWHAAVSIDFHFSQKYGVEILSRQISIFTHDCQIWLPSVKKGPYWSHSQCTPQYIVFFCCYPALCLSQRPHLNKNISSMLGCAPSDCYGSGAGRARCYVTSPNRRRQPVLGVRSVFFM